MLGGIGGSEHTANLACWLALWNWFTLQLFIDSQTYGFSSSHVRIWELDRKEDWVSKNWCFWTVVLEKTLESPLDCKKIKLVNPKGNQPWILIGRTDAEAESPKLWPPDVKNWLWKRPWCWKRLKAGGEGGDRGWDGRMAPMTQQTWVWTGSWRWWGTGKPGVLQSTASESAGHDQATEQQQPPNPFILHCPIPFLWYYENNYINCENLKDTLKLYLLYWFVVRGQKQNKQNTIKSMKITLDG